MKRILAIMIGKRILMVPAFLFMMNLKAQDIQFSQFYSAALYQNPAFAGSTHHTRGTLHQRLQWPGIDAKYTTSMITFDTYNEKQNSGYGLMVVKDWQGGNKINSLDIALQYAYEIQLNRNLSFRPGLQVSYVSRSLNYPGLTLPQDFTNTGYVGGSNLQADDRKQYVDFSSGGILYSEKMWVGISAHHLNRPNQSLYDGVSRLPTKFALTGGYKINLKKSSPYHHLEYIGNEKAMSITPTFHYKSQGKSDQLDIGLYGIYDFMLAGIWYRGMPIVKYYRKDLQNNESIVLMMGWKYEAWSVTYSYDFTISKLARARTGGSHELNLTYVYKKHKHHKTLKRLPCPDFNHH